MWEIFQEIADRKIRESMQKGEFDDLEGKGRPIVYEDDSMIPPDLRMAYKILRNSGHIPQELADAKEIQTANDLLQHTGDEQERHRQMQKLNCLVMKANMRRSVPVSLEHEQAYYDKVVERVSVNNKK